MSRNIYVFCTGDPHANWAYFQEQKAAHINFNLRLSTGCMTDFHEPGTDTGSLLEAEFPKLGPSKIQKNARIGKASDFWNRYEQDIKLAANLGDSPRPAPAVTKSHQWHGMQWTTMLLSVVQGCS